MHYLLITLLCKALDIENKTRNKNNYNTTINHKSKKVTA